MYTFPLVYFSPAISIKCLEYWIKVSVYPFPGPVNHTDEELIKNEVSSLTHDKIHYLQKENGIGWPVLKLGN